MYITDSHTTLRNEIYDLRRTVNRLQQLAYSQSPPALSEEAQSALEKAQSALFAKESELTALQAITSPDEGVEVNRATEESTTHKRVAEQGDDDRAKSIGVTRYADIGTSQVMRSGSEPYRGLESTGLEVKVSLQMEHVPTALLHLFNKETQPLIKCTVRTNSSHTRRLRITSYIEGYSARAADTIELDANEEKVIRQLPTLFPSQVKPVGELTRATINVLAEDLSSKEIEDHQTLPVWLLARNSVPLVVKNPTDQSWRDLSHYLGAFVTPHQPNVLEFLREVVDFHAQKKLVGYQGEPPMTDQVKAMYEALQVNSEIRYVNSVIDYPNNELAPSQRVRLPRETLSERTANCLDGTLLFASLMEAVSFNPCIVLIPGHAFVGWETWKDSNEWHYLETTMVADAPFEQAVEVATQNVHKHLELQQQAQAKNEPHAPWLFRQWSVKELRTAYGITPME